MNDRETGSPRQELGRHIEACVAIQPIAVVDRPSRSATSAISTTDRRHRKRQHRRCRPSVRFAPPAISSGGGDDNARTINPTSRWGRLVRVAPSSVRVASLRMPPKHHVASARTPKLLSVSDQFRRQTKTSTMFWRSFLRAGPSVSSASDIDDRVRGSATNVAKLLLKSASSAA